MKAVLSVIIILLFGYFMHCKIIDPDHDKIEWCESQTLCIYWHPSFRKQIKTSALHFTIRSKSSEVLKKNDFVFVYDTLEYDLRKKNKLIKYDGFYELSLVLYSSLLYPYYEDDIYVDDGPCYENELYSMILSGKLVFNNNEEITKCKSFKIIRGLKNNE